jgi:SH3-like domain-containing protein
MPTVPKGCLVVGLITVLAFVTRAEGQVPVKPVISLAEVTGNDVYVRSGPSANHYPVSKLMAGGRVTVVGETGDWYEIRPPEGVFSFISGEYVDTQNDRSGVVNGDNVRVRAGSTVPDFSKLKSVVQTQLSKGAEVAILCRDADGFLRIKPPPGTTVWVNRTYVEFVPPARAAGEAAAPSATPTSTADPTATTPPSATTDAGSVADPNAGAPNPAKRPGADASMLAHLPATEERSRLEEIDAEARAEIAKPIDQRRFTSLIERYRTIAEQDQDGFARQYAQARVNQLTYMQTLIETVQKMRRIGSEADSKRREFLEGRAKIREKLPPIPTELDAQGELRVSALYPPGSSPRRYRLVDPTGPMDRTIGYLEIPQDSDIVVDDFIGRYVGVRASAKRLQTGGVNPVPIYVPGELVLLQPTASEPAEQD